MTSVYEQFGVTVYAGDCLDVLAALPEASVHAVVTDPPYGLADHAPAMVAAALMAWATGDRRRVPSGKGGFMGRAWDAFVPPPVVWDECLRVLKPGGYVLAFSGSRTVDLMVLSIRMAGFEIRDSIAWLYASGFPKSLDVSKAIDKAAGAEQEVVGRGRWSGRESSADLGVMNDDAWQGGAARVDTAPATEAAKRWQGWGTALKPAFEPIVVARKPLAGTVASNVQEYGTGALNIDECRVPGTWSGGGRQSQDITGGNFGGGTGGGRVPLISREHDAGRWPSNVVLTHAATPDGVDLCADGCVPGCPVRELDEQAGIRRSGTGSDERGRRPRGMGEVGERVGDPMPNGPTYADSGGASRFFPVFRFEAKAPAAERPRVDGVAHPTVKPLALMRWLVRLVTPPGGVVLDPFLGSGTTAQAARAGGFQCIGIERDETYLPLIRARLSGDGDDLFGGVA